MPLPFRTAGLALLLAGLTLPALAQSAVDQAAQAYVSADGFEPQAIEHIEGALDDLLGGAEGMVPLDADISPIEKALLLIDTQESPLLRTRTLLRYSQRTMDGVAVSFIDIQRYNLGPAIREETIAEYGAENTADPEAFGVGPHVEWRFVTQPTSKEAALLLAAGRHEISDAEAAQKSCLPRPCLSLDTLDGAGQWAEPAAVDRPLIETAYPAVIDSDFGDGSTEISPAYLALELGIDAGIATADDQGILWTMPERQGGESDSPILVVIIDRNLGQETMSDAAMGIAKMGLDSEEYWVRISGGAFDGQMVQSASTAPGPLY